MPKFYLDSGGAQHNSGTTDTNSATASGTTNATCPANKTFASATDVNTGTDIVTIVAHGFSTGFGVILSTSSALPGGLLTTRLYFLRAVTVDTLTFHGTSADAQANTNIIDITSTGTGTQTITNLTVVLGGSPDLSSMVGKGFHARITTTGTSHVFTYDDAHGMSTGDPIFIGSSLGGGGSAHTVYYVNALSSTTIRLYTSPALAAAGGASTLSGSGTVNDRVIFYRADTHQYIKLNSSTVSGRLYFPIGYADNTNKFVVLAVNITGLGAGSTWAIGGRVTAAGCVDLTAALGNGDTMVFNTDISGAINAVFGNAIGFSGGWVKLKGKAGARRVWTNTGNGALVSITNSTSGMWFENLEMQSQGTGNIYATGFAGSASRFIDCRLTDSGAIALFEQVNAQESNVRCEFSGSAAGAVKGNGTSQHIGNWYHNNSGSAIENSAGSGSFPIHVHQDCIVERNTTTGFLFGSTYTQVHCINCVFYRSDGSGFRWSNTGSTSGQMTSMVIAGCLFKDNGDAATEFNLDWSNYLEYRSVDSGYNISGARGGGIYMSAFVLGSGDFTTDPQFNDPDNGTAANRDFSVLSTSDALGQSFGFLGNTVSAIAYASGAAQGASSTPIGALGANKRAGME